MHFKSYTDTHFLLQKIAKCDSIMTIFQMSAFTEYGACSFKINGIMQVAATLLLSIIFYNMVFSSSSNTIVMLKQTQTSSCITQQFCETRFWCQ